VFSRFRDPTVNPQLIFLGDSHPAIDIKSEFLPRDFYNFSYPGENWRSMLLRSILAFKSKPQLRYVVIPIDYHMFSVYRSRDVYFTDFLPHVDLEDIRAVYRPSPLTLFKARVSSALPLVSPGNRQKMRKVIGEDLAAALSGIPNAKAIYLDKHGGLAHSQEHVWPEIPSFRRKEDLRDRIDKHFLSPVVAEELLDIFNQFLALAAQDNIKVIGVRYPLSVEYKNAAKERDVASVENVYRTVPGIAAILDYRDLFDMHQEYFTDPDHLNSQGGKEFTKKLVVDLEKLIANDKN
jgi:hypothetical protein